VSPLIRSVHKHYTDRDTNCVDVSGLIMNLMTRKVLGLNQDLGIVCLVERLRQTSFELRARALAMHRG